jgi:NAD(P)-dependent dehydrogenase (short-subunit alcohol dehydrogenase family)
MSSDTRKTALVTGASRGIGKVVAIYLAEAGYDVAITARTVQEGEAREHSSTLKASNTKPLPGSLEATAAEIEEKGQQALVVPADLLDRVSLGAAVATVLERWGHVDVLVNNGRYIGPGHMDRFIETPIDLLDKHLQANVIAPLILTQAVLPGMIARGRGTIVNVTSASAYATPTKPAGEGGWGMGYGISKGSFHRVAGFLATELGDKGIRAFNVQPNLINTERMKADMGDFGYGDMGAPADIMGVVVAWLVTNEAEAEKLNGENIEAQFFCYEHDLLPGWAGPEVNDAPIRLDLAGATAVALEEELAARLAAQAD